MPALRGKIGHSKAYQLRIDGKTVDRFVDADSFDGITVQCESEFILDFITDDFSVNLDVSVLPFLGYTETNYHTMRKLTVEFYYYGRRIFGGVVGDVSFVKNDESLDVECHSYGRVIKELAIEYSSNFLAMYGYTPTKILETIIKFANTILTQKSYPFTVDNTSVDVVDFPFYKSLERSFIKEYQDFRPYSDHYVQTKFRGIYTRDGVFYLVFNETENTYALYKVDINNGNVLTDVEFPIIKTTLRNYHTGNLQPVFDDNNQPDDDNLPSGVVDIINADVGMLRSVVPDGNNGYLVAVSPRHSEGEWWTLRIVRYVKSSQDVYWAKYEKGVKIGEMLKDLAVMTNSFIWVGPNATIYLQNREGISDLDAVNAIDFSSSINTNNDSFELPSAYLVLEDVENDVIEYFNNFLSGDFYNIKAMVYKEEISAADEPIMLKNLPVKPALQKGSIVKVNYIEDTIELETKFRVANSG